MEDMIEKIKEYKLFFAIAAIGLLLGGYFLFHRPNSSASTVPDLYPASTSTASSEKVPASSSKEEKPAPSVSDTPEIITVDVKGAVKQPGVYELRSNSRVHDAIHKAGGMTADAKSQSVNLAQKLSDEAVIYVAKEGEDVPALGSSESPATSSAPGEKTGKVHLNRATEAELQTVSGIGQKRAQDIIAYREANGPFRSVEDLKNVSGIGEKTLEKLKDAFTVD